MFSIIDQIKSDLVKISDEDIARTEKELEPIAEGEIPVCIIKDPVAKKLVALIDKMDIAIRNQYIETEKYRATAKMLGNTDESFRANIDQQNLKTSAKFNLMKNLIGLLWTQMCWTLPVKYQLCAAKFQGTEIRAGWWLIGRSAPVENPVSDLDELFEVCPN